MPLSRSRCLRSALFLLWLSAQAITAPNSLASIYTYTDDDGVQTFTNEFDSIPEKYRDQVSRREFDEPQTHVSAPTPAAVQPPVSPIQVRTVTGSGEYRMGDHDRRADAVRLAIEAAKKDALEQVATYVEGITEVTQMDVTRDDIRSFTAGIVKVSDQKITSRLEEDTIVIRADLTTEIDPHEVAQAIAALRENENARQELTALRAETDQLQQQLDAANQALAAASSPEEAQQFSRQREDTLNELQANALVSQAWTSWAYPTAGVYSYPFIAVPGINGLLLQAQRLSPRHRHLPFAQQSIRSQPGSLSPVPPRNSQAAPRQSLLVPSTIPVRPHQSPLLNRQGLPAQVGDIVNIPTPRSVPPTVHQSAPQPYQLHPNHFWRPSPPNIHTSPSVPQQVPSFTPRASGGARAHGGGGGHFRSSGGYRGR